MGIVSTTVQTQTDIANNINEQIYQFVASYSQNCSQSSAQSQSMDYTAGKNLVMDGDTQSQSQYTALVCFQYVDLNQMITSNNYNSLANTVTQTLSGAPAMISTDVDTDTTVTNTVNMLISQTMFSQVQDAISVTTQSQVMAGEAAGNVIVLNTAESQLQDTVQLTISKNTTTVLNQQLGYNLSTSSNDVTEKGSEWIWIFIMIAVIVVAGGYFYSQNADQKKEGTTSTTTELEDLALVA